MAIIVTFLLFFSAKNYYELTMLMETTSDWAKVDLEHVGVVPLDRNNLRGASSLVRNGFLHQEKRSFDSSTVVSVYHMFLNVPRRKIDIHITKGDIGYAKLTVLNSLEETVGVYLNCANLRDDPYNRQSFSLGLARLKKSAIRGLAADTVKRRRRPTVVAFYYPWYGGNWHWNDRESTARTPSKPLLGYYQSVDEAVVSEHIAFAKQAGLDALIVSWWGQCTRSDTVMQSLAKQCDAAGLKYAIYFEDANSLPEAREQLRYLQENYANRPNYLREDGRAAIFLYERLCSKIRTESLYVTNPDFFYITHGFLEDSRFFDGFHIYGPFALHLRELQLTYDNAYWTAKFKNKLFVATVYPGFDNRLNYSPGFRVKKRNGSYFRDIWHVALKSHPDWIAITSFNEWYEGTEIEPSVESGDKYLRINRVFSDAFRAK